MLATLSLQPKQPFSPSGLHSFLAQSARAMKMKKSRQKKKGTFQGKQLQFFCQNYYYFWV
jgi:hypothetical protein